MSYMTPPTEKVRYFIRQRMMFKLQHVGIIDFRVRTVDGAFIIPVFLKSFLLLWQPQVRIREYSAASLGYRPAMVLVGIADRTKMSSNFDGLCLSLSNKEMHKEKSTVVRYGGTWL
ncbi:5446_t:CDS:2 [Paraglomus brasilianum]|uniref:5446_t:CDS:1 n=1 Tax=Paraglomus brasilianum TaxID=144538 RepID=A0A9N8YW51_9GLOM|nr:5446_t:CDS:2 [Paraglomus brasilianum]